MPSSSPSVLACILAIACFSAVKSMHSSKLFHNVTATH